MTPIERENLKASIKELGLACDRMANGARKAAAALNAFAEVHFDQMNAAVSASVLRGMGRPDIARYYE